jgi:hypothetical protein
MLHQSQKHMHGISEIKGTLRSRPSLLSHAHLPRYPRKLLAEPGSRRHAQTWSFYFRLTPAFLRWFTNVALVEREIQNQIDEIVREHVFECLKDHIPIELQLEAAERKRELEQLNLALHNS